jgi:hypothetical protein
MTRAREDAVLRAREKPRLRTIFFFEALIDRLRINEIAADFPPATIIASRCRSQPPQPPPGGDRRVREPFAFPDRNASRRLGRRPYISAVPRFAKNGWW